MNNDKSRFEHWLLQKEGTRFRDGQPLTAADLLNESRSLLWHAGYFAAEGMTRSRGLLYVNGPIKVTWPNGRLTISHDAFFRLRNGVIVRLDKEDSFFVDDPNQNVWLIVDQSENSENASEQRLTPKLTQKLDPKSEIEGWYTELQPLSLAHFGGLRGPAGAECEALVRTARTLAELLKKSASSDQESMAALGVAAVAEYIAQRVSDPLFNLHELGQELTRIDAWLTLLHREPEMKNVLPTGDATATPSLLTDVNKEFETLRASFIPDDAWNTSDLSSFIAAVRSAGLKFRGLEWQLRTGVPAQETKLSPPTTGDLLFIAVSMTSPPDQLNISVTQAHETFVIPPRDRLRSGKFSVAVGNRRFIGDSPDDLILKSGSEFACLVPRSALR